LGDDQGLSKQQKEQKMKKHYLIIAISMTLVQGCYTAPPYQPSSHVSGYPGVNIGIHYSTYPDLVRIPGYPVYYAPQVDSNYFFYDGLYWVFQGDNWYASSWYNGPWDRVGYYDVPVYILRVPVRYYRQPPPYFRGWRADAPPRWGDHWGRDWEQRRSGWDRWDRGSVPAPAPLPTYQRNYSGDRYPRAVEQQHTIRSENYRYQPREPVTQQHFKTRVQQDQQRQQELRQQEQRQQEQRQQELRQKEQRQKEQQQQDLERQRSQPEPKGKAKDHKASPQDQTQKDKDAQEEYERKKKEDEERYQRYQYR
jgi:flagellar biosynthesis GTPase FlhF